MKIAIGGLRKNEIEAEIKKAMPEAETIITTDIDAVKLLKNGTVEYYFGACESGGGAAISILIGMIGYSKCCTVCKNGGQPNKAEIKKFVDEGKTCFGMTVSNIDGTVPVLMEVLMNRK